MRSLIKITLSILFFGAFSGPEAHAVFLSQITSDLSNRYYKLSLVVDEKNLIKAIQSFSSRKNRTKTYASNVLGDKVTLVKSMGIDLVTLRCIDFRPDKGCKIEIEYPYNITYGNFDKFYAYLVQKNGQWVLTNDRGQVFTKMFLKAKKFLGMLVGIKKIFIQ